MTPPKSAAGALILNVDDNDAARYVKTRVLTLAGFRVVEARTGQEALELTRSEAPELVLLDVKLPDINGLEVCRRLKEDPATATVIVLQTSASLVDSAHRVRALDAGADSYLVEPIDAEELVANVKALLRMRRAEEAHRRAEGALRASEERFRQLAQSVSDVFWVLSPAEAGFEYVSPAYERLWGRSAEPLQRDWQEWFAAIHPEDRARVREGFARLFESGVYEEEYRIVGPDGQARWIAERGFPIRDAQAATHRFAGISQDVTSRKQAELLLLEADRHKDEFLAMLAHELRNPLGPIRSAVDLLARRGERDALDSRAISIIGRQADHLARLVDDLLDISRISHGKINLRVEPVELRAVLQAALETTREFTESRGHQVTLALPGEPIWVRGDAVRLSQVFSNLFNNAAKYTPEGGEIGLYVEPAEHGVRVRVVDNGCGIRAELLPRIFGLFTQGERTLDRSQGGLGIGLSLVRRLVELHGGTVQAASAGPGQGAEFSVVLPVTEAPQPQGAATAEAAASAARRVLVVDDNTDAAEAIGLLLRLHDHEVRVCGDGAEALAAAPVFAPDVVLLDVGLPGMNGYEVARALRRTPQGRGAILVALTGYGSESDRVQAQEAGFDHHLVKPADVEQLLAIIGAGRAPA
ncbi:hybrid sensor histidine kinase/response regulator [Caldimonas tepidiphila]|uniref:hybrid sensor histidine kinase/response regulator n=1 Tax=Caldimonas tepidiphila TaxID=2315841 RepID=UPI000E5A1FCE|nr:response regulator [Caldimonas tepidiphila]